MAQGNTNGASANGADKARRHVADEVMFESSDAVRFRTEVDGYGRDWWRSNIFERLGATPHDLAKRLAKAGAKPTEIVWDEIAVGRGARLRIERPHQLEETYLFDGSALTIGGRANTGGWMYLAEDGKGRGRFFRMLPSLIATAKAAGHSRIVSTASGLDGYALLKAGFLPDQRAKTKIIKDAVFQLARHDEFFEPSVLAELLKRIAWSGPASARIIASVPNPVPTFYLPKDAGVRRNAPFGRWLFTEACDEWTGYLWFEDASSMAIAREAAARPHPPVGPRVAIPNTPEAHRWDSLVADPSAPLGASGDAWRQAVRSAWTEAEGSHAAFDEIFPKSVGSRDQTHSRMIGWHPCPYLLSGRGSGASDKASWPRHIGMQDVKPVAVLKIYHDGSIVAWTNEPAFELGKASIMLRDGENSWDTVVRAIQRARKGVR